MDAIRNSRIETRVERQVFRDFFSIYLAHLQDGRIAVAKPLVFESIEPGQLLGAPTAEMRTEDAQLLMDELWRAGLRPTAGSGSAGSLTATERHLADMQKIAFHLLGPGPAAPTT